jgi:hypothetical protein
MSGPLLRIEEAGSGHPEVYEIRLEGYGGTKSHMSSFFCMRYWRMRRLMSASKGSSLALPRMPR